MVERAIAHVNTFVNIPETNTAIIKVHNSKSYLKNGGAEGILTPDPLLAPMFRYEKSPDHQAEGFFLGPLQQYLRELIFRP